jgi:hypothetical protein
MTGRRHFRWRAVVVLTGAVGALLLGGCQTSMTPEDSRETRRDINAVLADHDRELLALPGVVGVYVGLLPDQKTECLKVMLARKDPNLERTIPRRLEGYPVVTEVTGEIRPLRH